MVANEGYGSVLDQPFNLRQAISNSIALLAVAEQNLYPAVAGKFGYITALYITCKTASTTQASWTLKSSAGGATVLFIPQNKTVSAPGDVMGPFFFDQPLKSSAVNTNHAIIPDVATGGQWNIITVGFYAAL